MKWKLKEDLLERRGNICNIEGFSFYIVARQRKKRLSHCFLDEFNER